GSARPDLCGRPGVNPLRAKTLFHVTPEYRELLQTLAGEIDINAQHNLDVKEGFAVADKDTLRFGAHEFVEDSINRKETRPNAADLSRILASIEEAKSQSDYCVVSVHSHEMTGEDKERPAEFIRTFARACIDAGAGAVIGHGPHLLRGIERYKGGVIFYSLGNFLFENDTTTHQPADFYEKYGLSSADMVGKGMTVRSRDGAIGLGANEDVWRSVVASWEVTDGKTGQIRLHPIHLGMGLARYRRGLPVLAHDDALLEHLGELSREFDTGIRIQNHIGIIE
ncbi:MAG: CapA family protein, partial [Acetanaerobacterium sp.]